MSDLRTDRASRPVPGDEQPGGSPKRMVTAAIALGAVAAFGIGIWFAYDQGVKRGASGAPPLVRADQGPTKVAPENPGGMQIPNQDKQIYERLDGGQNSTAAGTERLLPPPERPTATPTQPNVTAAPTGSGSTAGVTVPTRPAPSSVPNQTAAPSATPAPATSAPATPAPATSPGQPAAKPEEPAKPAEAPKAAGSQTAAAPAPKPAAPSVASPGGTAKIQLASLKDQAAAQSTWTALQKKYPEQLSGLTPSYERVEIPNRGTFVRLQAGPLKDRAAAQALCQELAGKNQGCIVVGR